MLRILHDTHYDFIKPWRIAVGITAVFIAFGLGTFVLSPLRYSIEFTGGTMLRVAFTQPPKVEDIRSAFDAAGIPSEGIQQFGTDGLGYTLRVQDASRTEATSSAADSVKKQIKSLLENRFGQNSFEVRSAEGIGPRVGAELRRGAVLAILVSFALTLVYLAWRFEWRFGLAAVLATAHDILSTLAFIKLMNLEISLTVVAAILTVIGYSLNDTIIIFDRVRENLKRKRKETLHEVLNRSINETLPRSVITHSTTLAATLALLGFAGEVIRPFSWVMAFGIFTGTFSSVYIAGPVLLWIERRWPREIGTGGGVAAPAARVRQRPAES
jgi:preprotein translocase subunit SecF